MAVRVIGAALVLSAVVTSLFADDEGDWKKAQAKNTKTAYSEYISKHPNTMEAADARFRLQNPYYGFFATCSLGTVRAADGFVESHPGFEFMPLMHDFRDYLSALHSIKSSREFLSAHPGNQFGPIIRARIPALYLEAASAKVGIDIDVESLSYRGALLRQPTREMIRAREVERLRKELTAEGVPGVGLSGVGGDAQSGGTTHLLRVHYNEESYLRAWAKEEERWQASQMPSFTAPQRPDLLAEALVGTPVVTRRMDLYTLGVRTPVFSSIADLVHPADKVDMATAVKGVGGDVSAMSDVILMDQMRAFGRVLVPLARFGNEKTADRVLSGMPRMLLDSVEGFAAGTAAMSNRQLGVLSSFLKSGLPPDTKEPIGGNTLLMVAIVDEQWAHARLLVEAKAKVNEVNVDGESALHLACMKSDVETVKLLLESGADGTLVDRKGMSPLLIAAERNRRDLLAILQSAAGNLNRCCEGGTTPLIQVIRSGNTSSVSRLLVLGADPRFKCPAGDPPLVVAAGLGRVEIVKVLLDAGASRDDTDAHGRSALDVATQAPYPEVVSILGDSVELGRELRAWNLVKDANDVGLLEAFIRRFPDGAHRQSAEQRLRELKGGSVR
jgi:ankyrin repeat protein